MKSNPKPEARADLAALEIYVASGPELVGDFIDLSQNESPFGPSPAAVDAVQNIAGSLNRYPEVSGAALREALARRYGLDQDRIVCGSASDELIALLVLAYAAPGGEVLFPQCSFIYYRMAAIACGAVPVAAPQRENRVDVDALLERAGERTRICFIDNPCNPTGTYLSAAEIRRLREGLPPHVLLVIDAAYSEYVTVADYSNGVDLVEERQDTVMLRTLSKMHGLAGLRIGWAYCPADVAETLHQVRSPYNIGSAAIAAGVAAVGDVEHVARNLAHNSRWLARLQSEFSTLGLKPVPSIANFVLVEFPQSGSHTAAAAAAFLKDSGILVRPVAGFGFPHHLRITIGTDEQMERLLGCLRSWIGEKGLRA